MDKSYILRIDVYTHIEGLTLSERIFLAAKQKPIIVMLKKGLGESKPLIIEGKHVGFYAEGLASDEEELDRNIKKLKMFMDGSIADSELANMVNKTWFKNMVRVLKKKSNEKMVDIWKRISNTMSVRDALGLAGISIHWKKEIK